MSGTSSAYLINEPALQVLPSLACLSLRAGDGRLGVTPAITLQQVHFRARLTDDGWVTRSISQWRTKDFPFWDDATIKRAFTRLQAEGLLESEQSASTDRTRRYRVRYDELRTREVQIAPMEGGESPADRADASAQNALVPIEGEENDGESRRGKPPSRSTKADKGSPPSNVTSLPPRRGKRRYDEALQR